MELMRAHRDDLPRAGSCPTQGGHGNVVHELEKGARRGRLTWSGTIRQVFPLFGRPER